ncbi:MAG: 2-amino-4-hydroxy-6-hydroxymethyldihydropteridine diphosphokinase [Pseudomonadota bacterium]|nr:2-amino-4-hydroxy-6-hydroxymethyldihydropteridine diphosphokinase [Pseudomonadota bacterium]
MSVASAARRRTAAPVTAYIGLGANLGDVQATLDAAFFAIASLPGTTVLAASSLYRSAPVDAAGPDYLNAAMAIRTRLAPSSLLAALQRIERQHGRERSYRNAPRTLDLDLLLYGDAQISEPRLTVPHPRLAQRAFVLRPLAEIDSGLLIPGSGRVAGLLAAVSDQPVSRLPAQASAAPGASQGLVLPRSESSA